MKVVIKNESQTIDIEQLNPSEHTVVGRKNHDLFIVTRERYNKGLFVVTCVDVKLTNGDGWASHNSTSLQEAVKSLLERDFHVEAFESWKDALQWLIDNDPNTFLPL